MSASITMEVASTTAVTQMKVTLVPARKVTYLTVMDILVKVVEVDEHKLCTQHLYNYEILKSVLQIQ